MKIRIALLQLVSASSDLAANLAKGDLYCRQAAAMGADIALFPEMWSNGYDLPEAVDPHGREKLEKQAVDPDGPFLDHFRHLAGELNMAIALTYLERWPSAPRDSLTLFDRHGQAVMTYAKVHTCDFDREALLTPGEIFPVCSLDTAQGPVQVGAMICFDREFPESARVLMLKGAELILVPNACDMEENRSGQLRARAYENMVAIALCNYAAPQSNGHSVAFHPMAFNRDETSRDTLVVRAGQAEGIIMAEFDLNELRGWRSREVWGNAYRKPRVYSALLDENVNLPFRRKDARR